jgi:hypothetical protein
MSASETQPTAQLDLDRQLAATSSPEAIEDLLVQLRGVLREPTARWFGLGSETDSHATVELSSASELMLAQELADGVGPPATAHWLEVTATLRIFLADMGGRRANAIADRLVEVVVDWVRHRPMGDDTDLVQVIVYGTHGRPMRTVRIHMRLERLVGPPRETPPIDVD